MTMTSAPAPAAADQPQPRRGARVNAAGELLGLALVVAFAATFGVRWALLVAGVLLVVVCNMRAAAAAPVKRRPWLDRIARAIAAYRQGGTP